MDPATTIFWVLLAVMLEAFFSGSEIGMVSVNRIKMKQMAEEGNSGGFNDFPASANSAPAGDKPESSEATMTAEEPDASPKSLETPSAESKKDDVTAFEDDIPF